MELMQMTSRLHMMHDGWMNFHVEKGGNSRLI